MVLVKLSDSITLVGLELQKGLSRNERHRKGDICCSLCQIRHSQALLGESIPYKWELTEKNYFQLLLRVVSSVKKCILKRGL